MKKIILIALISVVIIGLTGCEKGNDCKEYEKTPIIPETLLNIEWKCVGFVKVQSCRIKKPKYFYTEDDCKSCYTLIFEDVGLLEDGTIIELEEIRLSGVGGCNYLSGVINEINYTTNNINIYISNGTEMYCPKTDEELYLECLNKVQIFSVEKNELRLYYNDSKNFLLFKKQQP